MRLLVISNLYPPFYVGGYELGCQDFVEGLRARGHEIRVLTSTYGIEGPRREEKVYRWLRYQPDDDRVSLYRILRREKNNHRMLGNALREFKPDLLYVWNPAGLSLRPFRRAHDAAIPSAFFVFDHWLESWKRTDLREILQRSHSWPERLVKFAIRAPLLAWYPDWLPARDFSNCMFASRYLKEQALSSGNVVEGAPVIHWGVDTEKFAARERPRVAKKFLYVGQIVRHKGVHTAIAAMRLLLQSGLAEVSLTIVGGSVAPEYLRELKRTVRDNGMGTHIKFEPQASRAELPGIYQAHDALVFPSEWDEPFGITILEAMSCGLPVVGTATGGSKEVLRHEHNGLTFRKGDAVDCAGAILRLVRDATLYRQLAQGARSSVEENFTLDAALDKLEVALHAVIRRHKAPAAAALSTKPSAIRA